MSKRTQKDSGKETVTAKSKPMMNLVSRCSVKNPVALSSIASESTGKTRHESQNPLSPQTEKYDRTVRPVVCAQSSSYSEWNIDKTWSSQEWKSDELMDDRTRRPVVCSQNTDQFIIENDATNSYAEAESELLLGSRSFLRRVNDQVRKRQNNPQWMQQKTVKSILWYGECLCLQHCEHVYSWWRITQTIGLAIKNTEDLTMKQMFDISEKLISGQSDEIYGVKTVNWEDSSWKYLSLVMNKSSVSSTQRSTYSHILYCVLERWTRTLNQILHGKTDWRGSKVHPSAELWTELTVSQGNSSGTSSQDSPHCSSTTKSKSSCLKWANHQNNLKDGSSSCRCSTTSHGDLRTTRKNASQMLNSFLSMQRDLEQDNGHSSDLDQRQSGTLLVRTVHKENGTKL